MEEAQNLPLRIINPSELAILRNSLSIITTQLSPSAHPPNGMNVQAPLQFPLGPFMYTPLSPATSDRPSLPPPLLLQMARVSRECFQSCFRMTTKTMTPQPANHARDLLHQRTFKAVYPPDHPIQHRRRLDRGEEQCVSVRSPHRLLS